MSGSVRKALPQVAVVALGLWLMVAPAVLGHAGTTAGSNDRFLGPTIASIAFVAASEIARPIRWVNVAAALWLIVAPWILGFPTSAAISDAVVGVLVAILSPMGRADMERRFGGGWRSVADPDKLEGRPQR